MKTRSLLLIIVLFILTSCGGRAKENVSYEIKYGTLNSDGTYTYKFADSSFFEIDDEIITDKIFKVGDKFSITIIKIEEE